MSLTYNKETNVALFRYTNKEGEPKALYLGKMPKREADHHEIYLEKILSLHLCPSLPKGEDFVFSLEFRTRKSRSSQVEKLKKKAKVVWQKNFQNLRASCESDWVREYDLHTATEWTGNSIEVAQKHYFMITPEIWSKATDKIDPEAKLKETLRSMVKTFGSEKVGAILEEIANERD